MPKPLIGITSTRLPGPTGTITSSVNLPYSKSITDGGGLPILIPLDLPDRDLEALLGSINGILFTGGYDIDPRQYGNPPHPKAVGIDNERDLLEIHLVQAALEACKPFLGICRGLQVINIALGGTLYEDILEQLPGALQHDNHRGHLRNYLAHTVDVEAGSRLGEILSHRVVEVNSLHHQGVRRLARELHPTAYAPDGLVEGFELPGQPFNLAVQWHPEELREHATMRRLFQAFVQACQTDVIN